MKIAREGAPLPSEGAGAEMTELGPPRTCRPSKGTDPNKNFTRIAPGSLVFTQQIRTKRGLSQKRDCFSFFFYFYFVYIIQPELNASLRSQLFYFNGPIQ